LEPENKPQPQREQIQDACKTFAEIVKSAGATGHICLTASPDGSQEGSSQIYAAGDFSTNLGASMLRFMFERLGDEPVAQILNYILSQPSIMAKMARYQSQQMAKRAEELKVLAGEPEPEPQPAQPAPSVPETKNKSWLN